MVAHSLSGTGYLVSNRRCSLSYLVSVAKMSILLNLIVVILFFFFSSSIRNIWGRRWTGGLWLNTSSKFIWSHHAPGAIVCITESGIFNLQTYSKEMPVLGTVDAILALQSITLSTISSVFYYETAIFTHCTEVMQSL